MASTCIVCLGDLRHSILSADDDLPPGATEAPAPGGDSKSGDAKTDIAPSLATNVKSVEDDEETIAHLLPCAHDLHHACLKPWVERATSCPICRAAFNMVELSATVRGPVLHSYAVQEKVQEAEIDPSMIVDEDELFAIDEWEPCTICGTSDESHEAMTCDGCNKYVHAFCAGYDDTPDVWYCQPCLRDLENDIGLPRMASAVRRRPRRRAGPQPRPAQQRGGRRNSDTMWARVWQEVSHRLDFDLDFPFDEEVTGDQRTDEQRREFERWEQRFRVAGPQGATTRLREIASARLQSPELASRPHPESQEEIRAWNAFDKARETQTAPEASRARKRKASESPEPDRAPEPAEARQPKRPRLRRVRAPEVRPAAESSSTAAQRLGEAPTFLSSLLHEVETKPVAAGSPAGSDHHFGQQSPGGSSPDHSPCSSGSATPVGNPSTPPPKPPTSPLLSSTIVPMPMMSPVGTTFSPCSPSEVPGSSGRPQNTGRRQPTSGPHQTNDQDPQDRASSASPTLNLPSSAKHEVQRMVKLALSAWYRDKQVDKDQYTDINRDVSRKLYKELGDASALAGQETRDRLQEFADEEVSRAVAALPERPASDI